MILRSGAAESILYGRPVNPNAPLNRGLVSWWMALPSGGKSNTFIDLAGKNHGTLTNGPTWSGALCRPGGFGALSFDGSDDYVSVPDSPATRSWAVTDYYVCFWFHLLSTPAQYDTVFTNYNFGTPFVIVSFRNGTTNLNIIARDAGGNIADRDAAVAATVGRWDWYLFGRSGTNLVSSVNGSALVTASGAGTGSSAETAGFRMMEEFVFTGRTPNGLLDDVRAANATPTDSLASSLYQASSRGYPTELNRFRRRRGQAQAAAGGGGNRRRRVICGASA